MLRRRTLVLFAALAVAACGSGSSSSPTTTTTTSTTTTTTAVPTTTAPPLPSSPASSAHAAATALMQAWRNGDHDAALAVATPDAVDALFSAGEPGSTQDRGCQGEDIQTNPQCVYRTANAGEVQLRTAMQGDGWIVEAAFVSSG